MLPAFVIGLREGLETVVILGAIALFLIHQGRRDQLRRIWIASAAAAVLCIVVALTLRGVETSVSSTAANRMQAVVSAAAVLTVGYMVVWMRRFPKDLVRDSESEAARRFGQGSARTLAAMAFFAVLREGFEISVFVLALGGTKAGSSLLGAVGATAGVLVAAVAGVAVVRGGFRLDIARFFRVTAVVLVLSAAGLAMTAISAANAGGWLVFGQTPQFNWSWITPPGSVLSSVVTGMFGIQPYPDLIEVVVWLAFLVPLLLVVVWPRRRAPAEARSPRARLRTALVIVNVAILAVLVLVGVGFRPALGAAAITPGGPAQMALPSGGLTSSYLLFRDTTAGPAYGKLGLVAADDPGGPRAMTSLSCDRVDFEGGVGLCLNRPTSGLVVSTTATEFNARFEPLRHIALTGLPSRARVSPDGHYGSVTTFVTGDSYAAVGTYSTRTVVIDMQTGKILFDLSQLAVTRDGHPFQAGNFNFWGVTFADDERHFFATLGTGTQTYLIEGDLTTRTARVITSNVECPSLSPDGKEIAFKRRVPGPVVRWRLSVLDLSTLKVHALAETRGVDDQAEWLDDDTIIYGVLQDKAIAALDPLSASTPSITNGSPLGTDTWRVPADGSGRPQLFTQGAWSEVVTGS